MQALTATNVGVRLVWRIVAVLAGALLGVVAGSPAAAHTELEFTLPTAGAAVGEPVSEIAVGFSAPVTLVGPGFEVLDPQGRILTPFAVTDDDTVFRLQLDPPIGGGEAAVRYEVRAEDGHTISGGFSFTVSADAPTTTTAASTLPATTVPATTVPAAPSTTAPTFDTATTANEPATSASAPTPPSGPDALPADGDDGSGSMIAVLAAAAAVAAGGFLFARSRWSRGS